MQLTQPPRVIVFLRSRLEYHRRLAAQCERLLELLMSEHVETSSPHDARTMPTMYKH